MRIFTDPAHWSARHFPRIFSFTPFVMREPLHKTRALLKMAEGRFASVYSVEEFILEHENKNTAQKTERDVRLLERFLKTKDEDRKIEDIPAAELNEFISEFIISVRTKVRVRVRVRVRTPYALFT